VKEDVTVLETGTGDSLNPRSDDDDDNDAGEHITRAI
jgi:hypothetical protein